MCLYICFWNKVANYFNETALVVINVCMVGRWEARKLRQQPFGE
ncbi:MAG: hypothetical protein JWR63_565 [Conexibacter sp.]|nr:hypothetical protein [Conexibacter sp.]